VGSLECTCETDIEYQRKETNVGYRYIESKRMEMYDWNARDIFFFVKECANSRELLSLVYKLRLIETALKIYQQRIFCCYTDWLAFGGFAALFDYRAM
jgi:hypothetical protein